MEKTPITMTEIAYIAGLFDGEGCVTCKQKKTKRKDRGGKVYNQWFIRCEIALTDQDVITGIHETLGFGWSNEKINKGTPKKRWWRWACGHRAALKFAKLMWPYTQVQLHKLEQIIDHYEPRAQELGDNVIDLETERTIRRVFP